VRDREIEKEGKRKSERQENRKRKVSGRIRDREIEKEGKRKSERQGNRKGR
jgi:hypothetical protein